MDGKIGTVDWSRSVEVRYTEWREEAREVEGGNGGEIGLREYSFFSFCVDEYSHVHGIGRNTCRVYTRCSSIT